MTKAVGSYLSDQDFASFSAASKGIKEDLKDDLQLRKLKQSNSYFSGLSPKPETGVFFESLSSEEKILLVRGIRALFKNGMPEWEDTSIMAALIDAASNEARLDKIMPAVAKLFHQYKNPYKRNSMLVCAEIIENLSKAFDALESHALLPLFVDHLQRLFPKSYTSDGILKNLTEAVTILEPQHVPIFITQIPTFLTGVIETGEGEAKYILEYAKAFKTLGIENFPFFVEALKAGSTSIHGFTDGIPFFAEAFKTVDIADFPEFVKRVEVFAQNLYGGYPSDWLHVIAAKALADVVGIIGVGGLASFVGQIQPFTHDMGSEAPAMVIPSFTRALNALGLERFNQFLDEMRLRKSEMSVWQFADFFPTEVQSRLGVTVEREESKVETAESKED